MDSPGKLSPDSLKGEWLLRHVSGVGQRIVALIRPRGATRAALNVISTLLAAYGAFRFAIDLYVEPESAVAMLWGGGSGSSQDGNNFAGASSSAFRPGWGAHELYVDVSMETAEDSHVGKLGGVSAGQRGTTTWHFWNDTELFQHALDVKSPHPDSSDPPKIAFMFLARKGVPFGPFWERYLKGHEGLYSIYLHSSDQSYRGPPRKSIFWGRQVPSLSASRNGPDMVDSEKRLLANALLDPLNRRFILISDSCVPVRPFRSLYNYLEHSPQSNVEMYNVTGQNARTGGRWNEGLLPHVPRDLFRKGSQWFEMQRKHARLVVGDQRYWEPIKKNWTVSDEHYIPSLFPLLGIEHEITAQSLTHVNWTKVVHSHPRLYEKEEVQPWLIEMLQSSSNTTYFARKFASDTLKELMALPRELLGF